MSENINEKLEFKNLVMEISEKLKSMEDNGGIIHYYWSLGYYAEELIRICLGDEGCVMPVDIESLAREMNIEVRDKRLNSHLIQNIWNGEVKNTDEIHNVKALNRRIGQLAIRKDSYTNEMEKIIYTDESVTLSAKRYAIANEITHYLLYKEENKDNEAYEAYDNYSIMPMCPTRLEELTIDIFSVFLLIPISQFFKVFMEFSDKCSKDKNIPIATEEWIEYLSGKAGLSSYYTACGYQYLRSVAYWIYRAHCLEENAENEDDDEKNILKYVKDHTKFFDRNEYEMLFQ